jgi:uncharacterized membrane protein
MHPTLPLAVVVALAATGCQAGTRPDTPASTRESPWEAAKARGVAFRGVGNEPGWVVEVDGGTAPAMRVTLDYGERTLVVSRAHVMKVGFEGAATDGTRVVLLLRHEDCSDGMSDAVYPVAATLNVGGQEYRGCGRFLADQR